MSRALRTICLVAPLLAAGIAFAPLVYNYFHEDDFLVLFQLRNETLFDFLTMPHGGHVQLTRNTLWYLLALLFDTSAARYFAAVLALHLLNVYLLFRVIRHLTGSARLACLGATLWGTAPANEGSLGWLSAAGHALVATALLLLLDRLAGVADGRRVSRPALLGWMGLLLAAGTSFGIGIGIALAFPAAVFIALPASPARTGLVLASATVAALLPLLYLGVTRLHPSVIASGVPLTLDQPWPNVLLLFAHLMTSGIAGLLTGAAFDWTRNPMPFAYVVAALFMTAMGFAFRAADPRTRRWLAVCALLAAAAYGSIAAGRAQALAPGSTVLFQVLRYHYVVPALLAIMLCLALAQLERSGRLALAPAAKNGLLAGALALLAGVHVGYGAPIDHHDLARIDTGIVVAAMRNQIAAAPAGGPVYIKNHDFVPIGPVLQRTPSIFPGWAALFVIFFPDNVVDGRRVLFVEDRLGVHFAANTGRRTADLFVASDAAPQAPASPEHGAVDG